MTLFPVRRATPSGRIRVRVMKTLITSQRYDVEKKSTVGLYRKLQSIHQLMTSDFVASPSTSPVFTM